MATEESEMLRMAKSSQQAANYYQSLSEEPDSDERFWWQKLTLLGMVQALSQAMFGLKGQRGSEKE